MSTSAPTNLNELMYYLQTGIIWAGAPTSFTDEGVDWSHLPTFGGSVPIDTSCVWSWDKDHLLMGTCADDLQIIAR